MSFYSSLYRASSRQKTMVVPRLSSSPTLVSELMSFFFHEREPTKSQNHVDSIDSLQDLVHRLPGALRKRKRGNIDPGAPDDPISLLFRYATKFFCVVSSKEKKNSRGAATCSFSKYRQTSLSPKEWRKYALFDDSRPYTRNLIATDNEQYTLLLLCWNPLHESPIHDHPCDGCWLQVLQGKVRECRYDRDLRCVADEIFQQGEVGYITDSMGYHKLGNPTNQPSVTLHLYSPPFQECRVWCHDEDAYDFSCTTSPNYSEYGKIIERNR